MTALLAGAIASPVLAADFPQPLPTEEVGRSETLPEKYPASWVFLGDTYYTSMIDARGVIIDTAGENRNLKGQFSAAQMGSIVPSTSRGEIYTSETYYSRGSRGERTDVLTIWDMKTLAPKGEILLPGGKRAQLASMKNSMQLTNQSKWALVFNFTPAASVTIVDLDRKSVLADVDVPGCSVIYPTGQRGFSSLCADGTIASIVLDEKGRAVKTVSSKPFNDIDNDPMFMMPAMVGKTAWFVTFMGNFKAIDLSGDVARVVGGFSIKKPVEGGMPEWRPGGYQLIASDPTGLLYVLANPWGRNGSHKDGGNTVWVVDPVKKALIRTIPLSNHSISLEVTREAKPSLVTARADGNLDIYDAATGKLKRSIFGVGLAPTTITAVQ
jgi:methylamine dehydrogenase heavy chain